MQQKYFRYMFWAKSFSYYTTILELFLLALMSVIALFKCSTSGIKIHGTIYSNKVLGAKCAISKLMYGLSVCTDDNHSLKLVAYRLLHTDELHLLNFTNI